MTQDRVGAALLPTPQRFHGDYDGHRPIHCELSSFITVDLTPPGKSEAFLGFLAISLRR
jgi:hypothetical protein